MHLIPSLAAAACCAAFACGTWACTTVAVGSQATVDGSWMIARSADSSALKAQHMVKYPARTYPEGAMYRTSDHAGATNFSYPQPQQALAYSSVPNWKTQLHGATGFNELGVGISGTESIFARDDALKLDPYNEDTGITEDDIIDVLLPRARSARQAVALLGEIIETIGAGEGFGVVFVDNDEMWYLETATGHQWLAQRTPKDSYFASANQGRLQAYEPESPDFMASKNLVSWAQEHGFYNPQTDGAFNFSKVYTRDDARDRVYNDPRVWQIQHKFNPSVQQDVGDGRNFAVYLKPEQKISLADLKAVLRDHYATGPLAEHDPYTNGLRGDDEPYRPISVFRTYEAHVMQVRPWLPTAIGKVTYLAMGMADLSVFVPYYQGLNAYPAHYAMGSDKADSQSLYWKYRKLQTLVMTDYPKLHGIVQKAYAQFEADTAVAQEHFERAYMEVLASDPAKAGKLLEEFNHDVMQQAEALTESLTNEIFTIRTEDIQKANFFANRKRKD